MENFTNLKCESLYLCTVSIILFTKNQFTIKSHFKFYVYIVMNVRDSLLFFNNVNHKHTMVSIKIVTTSSLILYTFVMY